MEAHLKLSILQKEFLKGIPNKKARQEQKIQFKLQNSYNGNVVFINGKFETDLEKLAHFMNGHPIMDIMFKEDFEEINGKGKTWYETSAKEVEEKWNKKVINVILSSEPTLTKEVLNDLTNPKIEITRNDYLTLFEMSLLSDLTLREVNCCISELAFNTRIEAEEKDKLWNKFKGIKEKLVNPEKQDIIEKSNNNDIPMEFCVEITKENVACLTFIWATFHKDTFGILKPGSFLHSNSLFTYCIQSNVPTNNKIVYIVSTEEFLRYIGKEDLTPKENNHKFIDYGEFKNEIPDFKHNFNQKPLEFDLPKKEDKVCLFIDEIINHASFPEKYIDKKILKAYLDLIYLDKKMNLNQI